MNFKDLITEDKYDNNGKFYDSNFAKYVTPKKKGFYIQYRTESSDRGFIGPFKNIKNDKHALDILKKEKKEEWADGYFYAYLDFYKEVK